MKNTFCAKFCNRPLLIWALAQLALAFVLVIPFSLTPAVWGGLLAFGAAAFVCAALFDQKVPRVFARILWTLAAVVRWALVAYVVYALLLFAPEATAGYDAGSRADIFAATLVPLAALCAVTLPSQAFVAARSKADARRVTLLAAFSAAVALLLYGYEVFAGSTVVLIQNGWLGKVLAAVAALVALAVLAVAFRGVLAQKGQPPEKE